jgi:transaldolase
MDYFSRLTSDTPTRVWINNPTREELRQALACGAVGCTTNPAYAGGLLKREPGEILPLIDDAIAGELDDERVAELVQERLVSAILPHFGPIYETSGGTLGYVSLQGAPDADSDSTVIEAQARSTRRLGINAIPKIPATRPGLDAFTRLVTAGEPTLVTEVFSLAQIVETCERYLEATSGASDKPVFLMAPITGIFGDHLRKLGELSGTKEHPAIPWAGVAFARAAAALVRDREYPVTLLFGGARTTLDLTGLVGERHQSTVNWTTFAELLAAGTVPHPSITEPLPDGVAETLVETFDDARRAMAVDGLSLAEFEHFGPVLHFRDNFIAGWRSLVHTIRLRRAQSLAGTLR